MATRNMLSCRVDEELLEFFSDFCEKNGLKQGRIVDAMIRSLKTGCTKLEATEYGLMVVPNDKGE